MSTVLRAVGLLLVLAGCGGRGAADGGTSIECDGGAGNNCFPFRAHCSTADDCAPGPGNDCQICMVSTDDAGAAGKRCAYLCNTAAGEPACPQGGTCKTLGAYSTIGGSCRPLQACWAP